NTAGVVRRILGEFGNRDHRQFAADDVALERIVIGENQRVDPNVQCGGDPANVGSLVVPVGDEATDVGSFQDHLRMPLERSQRIFFIVLGANRQNHAALRQL